MGSRQQFHFMHQPHARAHAVDQAQEQNQHKITLIVAYAIASAIIVLWMAYLPTLTNRVRTNVRIEPTHLSFASDSVNRANKGDQLTSVRFSERWNAFATMPIQTLAENGVHARATKLTKNTQPIPVGCEPAFSQLVKAGNFSARCIASANIPTWRLA